jgi:hypothetical protein
VAVTKSKWFWLLAGWVIGSYFGVTHLTGLLGMAKKSG